MILKFEFKKLFSNKIINIIVLILLILNGVIFYNTQKEDNKILINNKDRYYELVNYYNNDFNGIDNFKNDLDEFSYISYVRELYLDGVDVGEDGITLITEESEILNKYNESVYSKDNDKLIVDRFLVNKLWSQINYIDSYDSFLETIENQKDDMLSVSIFNKKGTFSYNNIIKTAEDFKTLENTELKLDMEEGIISISNYYVGDIVVILIAFILCLIIFSYERETDILLLLKSTKKGRGTLIFSKICTLIISITILTIAIYGSIILLSNKLYGFGDLSRSLQSISEFRGSNLIINIEGYLKAVMGTKILTSLIIGVIFALIFQISKNLIKTYVVSAAFLVISFLAFKYISANSYINIFKNINIFTFLLTRNLLGEYTNVNIFTRPINLINIYKFFIILVVPILISINIILFIKEKEIKKKIIEFKVVEKIKIYVSNLCIPTTLFFNEFNKIIFKNKLYILFLIVLVFSYKSLNISEEISYTTEQKAYKYYLTQVSGKLDEKKIQFIEDEKYLFENTGEILEKLNEKLENKEISQKEYNNEFMKMNSKLQNYNKSFNDIYNQYLYVDNLKTEKGINGQIVDNEMIEKLFLNEESSLIKGILISVILIIFLSNMFPQEYESGAIHLIQCSRNRSKIYLYKYLISFIGFLIFYVLVYGADYINIIKEYGTIYLNAPIQSVPLYEDFPGKLNILNFLILTNAIRFIGIFLMSLFLLNISILSKSQLSTTIIGTIIIVPSVVLSMMNIKILEKLSFTNVFNLNYSLSLKNSIFTNLVYFLVLLLIVILIQGISFNSYRNKGKFYFK